MIEYIILAIGLYHFGKLILSILWQIVKEVVPKGDGMLDKYGRKEGRWAVVTGGTDGIGLGFCEVLAEMGWNLCIISRNQQKIKSTIASITESLKSLNKPIPSFLQIPTDFKHASDPEFFPKILSQLRTIKIGILVNNVGTGYSKPIEEVSWEYLLDLININVVGMAGLTRALVPQMMGAEGRTAVVNLSSFIAEFPAPYSTVYGASKSFNTYFSEALALEENLKNIDFISVRPMFVVSPLSKKSRTFTIPDRRQCARASLKQLSWGETQTNGYFVHRLYSLISHQIPGFLIKRIVKKVSKAESIEYNSKS